MPTTVAFGGFVDLALGQSFCLHLSVDLGVNVGRVERDVHKPGADGVDVHSGSRQVRGCGMSTMSLET